MSYRPTGIDKLAVNGTLNMKEKTHKKNEVTMIGWWFPTGLMLIFVPVGVFGYYTYGSAVDANIFMSLSDGYPKMIGQALISAHVFFAFVLISNPLYQECEDILNVQRSTLSIAILITMTLKNWSENKKKTALEKVRWRVVSVEAQTRTNEAKITVL